MDAALDVLWFTGQVFCVIALGAGAVLSLFEINRPLKGRQRPPGATWREPLVLPEEFRKTA